MAATYDIQGSIVYLRLVGDYSVPDIEQAMVSALADPKLPVQARILMDVTQSESLTDRTSADIRHMAQYLAKIAEQFGKCLGIAAGSKVHYGMMRMAEVYSETSGMRVRVFLTVEDTEAWLLSEQD